MRDDIATRTQTNAAPGQGGCQVMCSPALSQFQFNRASGRSPRPPAKAPKCAQAITQRQLEPHVLRHTFSVTAIQKGISLPALQRLLGHDRLTTTEIYLNLSPEEVLREFHEKW